MTLPLFCILMVAIFALGYCYGRIDGALANIIRITDREHLNRK